MNKMNKGHGTEEVTDGSVMNGRSIQALLSGDRSSILESIGGYGSASGSFTGEGEYEEDMDYGLVNYKDEDDENETSIKLRYEGQGVKYVLLIDETNGTREVIAEDKEGNYIPEYPVPNAANCVIDHKSKTAKDTNYHYTYEVRFLDNEGA
jgi:hypothetical protein